MLYSYVLGSLCVGSVKDCRHGGRPGGSGPHVQWVVIECVSANVYNTLRKNNLKQSLMSTSKPTYTKLPPSITLVNGHCRLSYKQENQLQPMAGYRQTRNLLPSASQPWREKTITNGIYPWQFKYINTTLLVLYMSNGISVSISLAFIIKELSCHPSCEICLK